MSDLQGRMAPTHHLANGPMPSNPTITNPSGSGPASAATAHQNTNAVNGNSRPQPPPIQERSRNARAQARHRAKRKAYIEQLEETVQRLQAALSPYPPFNAATGASVNGTNDQSLSGSTAHAFALSSPNGFSASTGNALIGFGQSSNANGSVGNAEARLRALDLECTALRTYAETLRGLLQQYAPTVQVPPIPLPSTLPASTAALHSSSSVNQGPGGTLPPLNATFPSFAMSASTGSMASGTNAFKMDSPDRVGMKRQRRDSNSCSLSESGSGFDKETTVEATEIGMYSTPTGTPPHTNTATNKGAANTPIHASFPSTSINGIMSASGRTSVSSLTLPPVPQSQPTNAHTNHVHPHTLAHQTPPPAYTYPSNQSQPQVPSPQLPQRQSLQQSQAHAHGPPQMTSMPAPLPWSGGSSVPSHANNTHTHGLQLPPPVPRFAGAPHLTRGFAYPLNATTSGRQDGAEGDGNIDKGKTAGLNGGAGMILKREEEGDTHLSTSMYSAVGGDSPYAPRHAPGRHQQHESLHSISPTSATAPSPALTFSAVSRQHHPQLPSPHTHQQNYHEHSQQTAQRGMTGSSSQQQSQSHYHNPQHQVQTPQHHQHQPGGTTLPSPHSPYSPVGPTVPFRGYEEERYHPEAHHQHHQAGPQNQSQNQDYLWQTGTVYGN